VLACVENDHFLSLLSKTGQGCHDGR